MYRDRYLSSYRKHYFLDLDLLLSSFPDSCVFQYLRSSAASVTQVSGEFERTLDGLLSEVGEVFQLAVTLYGVGAEWMNVFLQKTVDALAGSESVSVVNMQKTQHIITIRGRTLIANSDTKI